MHRHSEALHTLEHAGVFADPASVFANIARIKPERYLFLMDNLKSRDVTYDREYQKVFNAFYQLRRKLDGAWYRGFYELLERHKLAPAIDLIGIMRHLYALGGGFEYSYATKLLHTLDPRQPIVDRKVLACLSLERPKRPQGRLPQTQADRLFGAYDEHYRAVQSAFARLIADRRVGELLEHFDERFAPLARIHPVKKLDLVLWKLR